MPLSADISTALHLLEHVQERLDDCDDPKLQMHTSQDLKSLICLLEDPVFRSIVTMQDSLLELNSQLGQHPSILPGDFDINVSGQLELSVPTIPVQPLGQNIYQDLYQDSSELEDQRVPVAPLVHSSSEDTSAQINSPSLTSEVMGMPPITTPTYAKEFKKVIEAAACGRQIFTVQLYKPEGTSLGFSVVGLRCQDKGEVGIFLQEIQPNGIAGCDGRLVEGDQILAIDGQPLDSNISHEQAISILQKARGLVELVVARSAQDVGSSLPTDELSGGSSSTAAAGAGVSILASSSDKELSVSVSSVVAPGPTPKSSQPASTASAATPIPTPAPTPTPTTTPLPGGLVVERSPSAVSDASKSGFDMVLMTEWSQVEVINLINDGSGLGFGIVGGRSTGVVVKTILPGGVADRDNRLQSGDHILQIGDVNLRRMGSEQVATVLRQSGTHVQLVVARPAEPPPADYQPLGSHAPVVPTKILADPDELNRRLVHSVPETYKIRHVQGDTGYDNGYMYTQESDIEMHARPGLIMDVVRNPMPIGTMPVMPTVPVTVQIPELPVLTMDTIDVNSLPEMERFTVELKKDIYGLGITIAGYVCEKEELSGIFVKSISEGSAADLSNKIQINDRIVEVDGHSLQGYSNHEAVEVLRRTGQTVVLCLERYLRGPKYEQLQQAIAASESRLPQPSSPSITSLPSFPISGDGETTTEIEPEGESHTTVDSAILQEGERERSVEDFDDAANVEALLSDPSSELTAQIRAAIKSKWQKIVGPDTEIVVAQLKKFAEGSGLGISLEGTVDVENGQEVRPHHYIRSILPEGPVGQNGTLRSGDELLEVNGYRLLGINHMEVVSVLKELPIHVRMVCGRNISSQDALCPIDTAQHQAAFQTRSILGGSLQNLLPTMDRLVKAKSDGSLASTTTTATVTDASLNKMKSRSLEPLTGLAMWSSEPQIIELVKGERGLGFSILDYQDPMNPNETVIVIRSLVPGGVAQVDGQLIPGDRLLFVNDIALENATLDEAVQALKGAPKGTVRIGVAKPLPIPDSIVQRVPAICPVRRSKSFPNESDATDRAAGLEDFLSSRSGATDASTDKPEVDEDEKDEHWTDASPITPVCSPARRPLATKPHGMYYTKTLSIPIKSEMIECDGITIVTTTRKLISPRQDSSRLLEKVAPKVKIKPSSSAEARGAPTTEKLPEAKSELHAPISSLRKLSDQQERRKTLQRHSSLDSEGRDTGSKETLDKSETSSEKGAKRKVLKEKSPGKKKSRKAPEKPVTLEQEEDEEEEIFVDMPPRRPDVPEDVDHKRKEHDEHGRRSREERKSLKQQECIDRVTEFLAKHSLLNYSDLSPSSDSKSLVSAVSEEKREQRVRRPSLLGDLQESPVSTTTLDESSTTPTRRKGSLKRVDDDKSSESTKVPSTPGSDLDVIIRPAETMFKIKYLRESPGKESEDSRLGRKPTTPEAGTHDGPKRPSSLRKKRDTFSRESSRESLLDETKKEVRIQENVEEIFFEDASEHLSLILPEVQLVTARIITAEEAVANRIEELPTRIDVQSPPETVTVPGALRTKSARVPSPDRVAVSQLQLPALAKSTSENALIESEVTPDEENRISQRNIRPEILMDLSKVIEDQDDASEPSGSTKDFKEKKPLTRTGSEGSKRSLAGGKSRTRDHRGFKLSSLAQPDEAELTILLENVSLERKSSWDIGKSVTCDNIADLDLDRAEKPREASPGETSDVLDKRKTADVGSEAEGDESEVRGVKRTGEEEAEEGDRKDLEGGKDSREYESVLQQQRRPLLGEKSPSRHPEDSLISKEHSLEYQSQTLESQADHLLHEIVSSSLENLLRAAPESWSRQFYEEDAEVAQSFKETQYSPKEKCDAHTQTVQETKSTQCSPEQCASPSEVSEVSQFHVAQKYYQSPKREVETQTQGNNKSVQCSLDDLGELSFPRTADSCDLSFDSPSKSERVHESKSVQCIPDDISTSPTKSWSSAPRTPLHEKVQPSPRREVEVQTYQESKAVQCSDDEFLEAELTGTGVRFRSRPASFISQKSESSASSSCSSPHKYPTVVFVEERSDMTVTHRDNDGNVAWANHWGPERQVEIVREAKTSLGLSIVGGKVDLHNGSSSKSQNISGIFIKNVLPNSPAGRTGELKVGDRIIEVDGVDLRHSTHERAVQVIQSAGNPVRLVVQSLVHLNEGEGHEDGASGRRQSIRSRVPASGGAGSPTPRQKPAPVSPARSTTPEVIQGGSGDGDKQSSSRSDFKRQSTRASDGAGPSARRSSMKKSIRKKAPSPPSGSAGLKEVKEEKEDAAPKKKYSSDESSEEEDARELEGNVYTKAGMEISRKSAGNVKRSRAETEADPEKEDEYGYTAMKIQKKYHNMGHKVVMVKVEKERRGLGIALAGHKDRNRMAVFICGLNPKGAAEKAGGLAVGDEILEVNGQVLKGRCHLNASAVMKGLPATIYKIVVFRRTTAMDDLAVKPITQFPVCLEENTFAQYKGVRNVPVKKGQYGLGIMIIEGKHAEVGQGIFISDIQEGSAAEQAGLQVGDLILAVNMDCLLGASYDQATGLLKKAEGMVTLVVCNPNQKQVAKEEEDRAKGILPKEPEKAAAKEPEKPKEPEPPKDPKEAEIVEGRDSNIEFQKDKDKGIGFTICGGSDTPMKAVFIIEVFPDGAAGKDGRLNAGDQILDFCSQPFKDIAHEEAHATVLKASGTITMSVHRPVNPTEEIEVELQKKSGKGAGLCLTGFKSGKGAYVSDLLPGGSALEGGKICKGDRVVAVGGQDVRDAPVEDIAVHVKVSNPVQLKLARYKSAKP